MERMYRAELLGRAVAWEDNPQRDAVLLAMERVVLADNIDAGQPLEVRRSLAGDKVELYMALLHEAPEEAAAIAARARGTWMERLLDHAEERHRADLRLAAEALEE